MFWLIWCRAKRPLWTVPVPNFRFVARPLILAKLTVLRGREIADPTPSSDDQRALKRVCNRGRLPRDPRLQHHDAGRGAGAAAGQDRGTHRVLVCRRVAYRSLRPGYRAASARGPGLGNLL